MYAFVSIIGSLISLLYLYASGKITGKHLDSDKGDASKIGLVLAGDPSAHDKWIVASSVAGKDEITHLASIPGWKLLVVGDKNMPSGCSHPNCVYLGPDEQSVLGFNLASHLPSRGYARKNIGYLYAIAHGAEVIYEMYGDLRPKNLDGFILKSFTTGLLFNGANVFNPYHHFGQPTLWPRGYPISSVGDNDTFSYLLDDWSTPIIQQALISGNPEVDLVVQLTRKKKDSSLGIEFDSRAPPAFVGQGVFSPFVSQNTVFRKEAFWALYLPSSVPEHLSDIWRGYWAQRLLWEIDGTVAFLPPNTIKNSSSDFNVIDSSGKNGVYYKTENLIKFFREWTCRSHLTFYWCVMNLAEEMANHNFWDQDDAKNVRHWIEDLKTLRVSEPKRVPYARHRSAKLSHHVQGKRHKSTLTHVQFVPEVQSAPGVDLAIAGHHLTYRHLDRVRKLCPKLDTTGTISGIYNPHTYSNIVLTIVLNDPRHFENIRQLDILYSRHFPHIVYCGDKITNFYKISSSLDTQVTFVEAKVKKGKYGQRCLVKVMQMNYNVDGYLMISEDTLLNVWTLGSLPQDKIWFLKTISFSNATDVTRQEKVKHRHVLRSFTKALKEMEHINRTLYNQFKREMFENTNSDDDNFLSQISDLVYIPEHDREEFLFFLDILTDQGLERDVAIPTAIGGAEKLKSIYYLDGHHEGKADGKYFQQYFHKNFNYVHPVSIAKTMKTSDGLNFFCKTFLPLALAA